MSCSNVTFSNQSKLFCGTTYLPDEGEVIAIYYKGVPTYGGPGTFAFTLIGTILILSSIIYITKNH